MSIEQFDQLGEIGKGAGEAVDFVIDHDIDPACLHLGEKHLQGRAIERGSEGGTAF
jgi:hypothetical protein